MISAIPVSAFLRRVEENADRILGYELGHDGTDGKCDCIGLIIGAVRLSGIRWAGTHGSNYAARNAMEGLEKIGGAFQLFPGMIVYKAHEPGETGYGLPSAYSESGDRRDYYHVGVVTAVNPLTITHCTGVKGGIKRDSALGRWQWGGKLKYVSYEKEEECMETLYQASVWADNGYPVKLRETPRADGKILMRVPLNTTVDVAEETDEAWLKIRFGAISGYMMRKFLIRTTEEQSEKTGGAETDGMERKKLAELCSNLAETLKKVAQLLEGGNGHE